MAAYLIGQHGLWDLFFILLGSVQLIASSPILGLAGQETTVNRPTKSSAEVSEGTKSYEGYRLLTVIPRTASAGKFLAKLAGSEESLIDFWQEPRMLFHNVTFSVAPEAYENLLQDLMTQGMIPYIITDNLQELLDAERKQLGLARKKRSTDTDNDLELDQYNRHPAINRYLDELGRTCNICEVMKIGTSHEGRNMKLIKIGKNESSPGIFIDAGIHAREWIAPATALYIINQLLGLRSGGSSSRWLLETYTWYILPVVNPDGYEYSWDTDRLWRKSRSKHEGNDCTGTDLNRNFDFHWREIGASSHSCASTYAGPRAFSEPESTALSRFLASKASTLIGYLTLHSYGQYWLTPWGFTRDLPLDYNHLAKVAHKATRALRRVHGRYYMVGSSTNVYYAAAGGSDDWAKGAVGIKYSYTVELRRPWWEGRGFGGFILDTNEIRPQGQEFWAALRAMAREIRTRL